MRINKNEDEEENQMSIAPARDEVRVRLPDGSEREYPRGVTVRDVAESIGARLGKAALAGTIDGRVVDLGRTIETDSDLRILTERDTEALDLLRHSAAHILATAVRRVHPEAKIGFGPSIEDGFYYDFEVAEPFTPEDLERIEVEMAAVAKADDLFQREVVDRARARELFADDPLKLERLEELGDGETITVYRNGPFTDLCRGPHVPSTGRLKHFKLLNTAAAYWRGDSKRQTLHRIYGTAFFTKEALDEHLFRLEEAKRRDHRRLGRELDLFFFHPFSPGSAFWTHRGTLIYQSLVGWMNEVLSKNGYESVKTPLLFNKALWEISGHWGKYRENMFLVLDGETSEHDFSLKPMNCPSHHLMFGIKKRSYRDLPIRYATQDVLHRNEVSGALSGLTRVRQFQQDDAHVYLAESQIADEVKRMTGLLNQFYSALGLEYTAKFATRPEVRIGTDEMWDHAEATLLSALEETGIAHELKPGDGAFYGPKIDFDVSDSIGRKWQLGTIQLDYGSPERFDLSYVGEDNKEHRPVIIHRAIFGSFERFIAILIEHFAGAFPVWLSPVQVVVLPISDAQNESARALVEQLQAAGIRAELDDRSETLNYKIREAETGKVPYMAIVGAREAESETVAVRVRGAGRKQEVIAREELVRRVRERIDSKSLEVGFGEA
jgi:threonyl-tRNA synthetase